MTAADMRLLMQAKRENPVVASMLLLRSALMASGLQEAAIACGWSALRIWGDALARQALVPQVRWSILQDPTNWDPSR